MQDQTTIGERRTLTVRGRGTASVEPDLVVLTFAVAGRAPSYSVAVEKLNERVEALRNDLEAADINRMRLKTTSFDVQAERPFDRKKGEHVFLGHWASHRMRLELELDRELLNRVLERVARSASEAAVTISFDVADKETLRRRAMQAAVADARETARVLAGSAGVRLGEIEQIDYSFIEVRMRSFSYNFAMYEASSSGPITAADIEPEALDAEEGVTVVWSI